MLAAMPRPSLPPAAVLLLAVLPVGIVLPGCNVGAPSAASAPAAAVSDTGRVGRQPGGRLTTPVNQEVTPLGRVVDLPGLRPQALALSPDGASLLVSGKTSELLVLDPATGEIRQRVALPNDKQAEPQPRSEEHTV